MDFSNVEINVETLSQLSTPIIPNRHNENETKENNTLSFAELCELQLKENQKRIAEIAQQKWNKEKKNRTNICDYKHHRAELLLCGYFRKFRNTSKSLSYSTKNILNMSNYLPPLVITLCYSYYCYAPIIDQWIHKGKEVIISLNGQLATFKATIWHSVFGSISVCKGKHKWNIEILNIGNGLIFGVSTGNKLRPKQISTIVNEKFVRGEEDYSFGWYTYRAYGLGLIKKEYILYTRKRQTEVVEDFMFPKDHNFVITVLVDMTDEKVSFFKNGEFIATIDNIRTLTDDEREFVLAVAGTKGSKVNLLSYQKLSDC
eukprot:122286_1